MPRYSPVSRDDGLSSTCVVVVDDEPTVVDVFTQYLNLMGLRATGFTDPQPALEFLRQGENQVLVTDMFMPELTGLELVAAAKQAHPRLKVVLVSGVDPLSWPAARREGMNQVDAFLAKPMALEALSTCCRRLLAEA